MSPVAKILVVLNLLLAIAFLGASATYLGQKESWKKKHDDLKVTMQEDIDNLTIQRDQAEENFNQQRSQTAGVQTELAELKARWDAKQEEFTALTESHNALVGQYERLSQTYTDLQQTIDQLNADKTRLIGEKDDALAEKRDAVERMNNAIVEARRLEGEIASKDDLIGEMEKNQAQTSEELEQAGLVIKAYKNAVGELPGLISPEKIDAMVSGVNNDLNIVLLSVGRDDGVKKGYTFTVYRGGQYVATVVVDDVEQDVCSGYSKKELEKGPIMVGDQATTQL